MKETKDSAYLDLGLKVREYSSMKTALIVVVRRTLGFNVCLKKDLDSLEPPERHSRCLLVTTSQETPSVKGITDSAFLNLR